MTPKEAWLKTHRHNSTGRTNLTPRHLDILRAVKGGANTYRAIAEILKVSTKTIKVYFSDPGLGIYNRLGLPKEKRTIESLLTTIKKRRIKF